MQNRLKSLILSLVFLLSGCGDTPTAREPVIGRNGMASTVNPIATEVAISILKQGGSAIDAAIAANAVLGLMEPGSCGIGGDLCAIVWDPHAQKLHGYEAIGYAPKHQSLDDLRGKFSSSIPSYGSACATVPGAVDGWFALHQRFGRMSMADLLAPAITYALEGFPVGKEASELWAYSMRSLKEHESEIEEFANAEATFLNEGQAPRQNELFKNFDLANTLTLLANEGREAFYKGPIAKTIDAYMQRIGGALRLTDFAEYRGRWVDPISVNYRGYDVYELPPSTQGAIVLQMLKLLEPEPLGTFAPNSARLIHRVVEAKRLAFEDAAYFYADPTFSKMPIEALLTDSYIEQRRSQLGSLAMRSAGPGLPLSMDEGDTVYITVADKDGMMVSLIQSTYLGMGCGLVPDGLGFMMQNRGSLFSLNPKHANAYAPRKRPFHTIIPGFVLKDGQPWVSLGVVGASMQPQGQVQVLINLIDHGMNIQEAGDSLRFRHRGGSQPDGTQQDRLGVVCLEDGGSGVTRWALRARGHRISSKGSYGLYQAIAWDKEQGIYYGADDSRSEGKAVGY